MVYIERIAYELGSIAADIILFTIMPTGVFSAYKVVTKFSDFASAHALANKTSSAISDNLMDCLPLLE